MERISSFRESNWGFRVCGFIPGKCPEKSNFASKMLNAIKSPVPKKGQSGIFIAVDVGVTRVYFSSHKLLKKNLAEPPSMPRIRLAVGWFPVFYLWLDGFFFHQNAWAHLASKQQEKHEQNKTVNNSAYLSHVWLNIYTVQEGTERLIKLVQ